MSVHIHLKRRVRDAAPTKEDVRKLEAESNRLASQISAAGRTEARHALIAKKKEIDKKIDQMAAVVYGIYNPRPGEIKRLHGPRNPYARDNSSKIERLEYEIKQLKQKTSAAALAQLKAKQAELDRELEDRYWAPRGQPSPPLKGRDRKTGDALKLIQTYTSGSNQVKVYKDDEWGEYRARLFFGGRLYEPADYHSDDKADVLSTAQAMLRNAVKPKGWKDAAQWHRVSRAEFLEAREGRPFEFAGRIWMVLKKENAPGGRNGSGDMEYRLQLKTTSNDTQIVPGMETVDSTRDAEGYNVRWTITGKQGAKGQKFWHGGETNATVSSQSEAEAKARAAATGLVKSMYKNVTEIDFKVVKVTNKTKKLPKPSKYG